MIFVILTSPQGPRGRYQKCAVARPIHVSNSSIKFGWIVSNGLGDSITGRGTDGGYYNIPFDFLKNCGDNDKNQRMRSFCNCICIDASLKHPCCHIERAQGSNIIIHRMCEGRIEKSARGSPFGQMHILRDGFFYPNELFILLIIKYRICMYKKGSQKFRIR